MSNDNAPADQTPDAGGNPRPPTLVNALVPLAILVISMALTFILYSDRASAGPNQIAERRQGAQANEQAMAQYQADMGSTIKPSPPAWVGAAIPSAELHGKR